MYDPPVLHIRGSYDGGEIKILAHNKGRNREIYSSVSTVRIMNNTGIWCSVTNHSNIPPTTTCKHHVFTNSCQDEGNNNIMFYLIRIQDYH